MPERPQGLYAEEEVVASAARTVSGDTGLLSGYGTSQTLRAQLNVTVASGTGPSLSAFLEDSVDGTNWNAVGTFAAKTAAGLEVINVTAPFSDRLRVRWAITGTTPSFQFSIRLVSQGANA